MPTRDLLIASPSTWDECCFAVPAVRALAASGLAVGVLCRDDQRAFWSTLDGVEVVADISGDPWQAALLWEDGPLAKRVVKARIEKRIGPTDGCPAKRLTHPLRDAPHPTDHRVQYYLKAAAAMGVATDRAEFFAPAGSCVAQATSQVLLLPDSDYGVSHEWQLENWVELGTEMMDWPIAVHVGQLRQPKNRGLGIALSKRVEGSPLVVDLDPARPDLDALASYTLVVAADGSLPHLAAHLGSTCLTLFGPNNPTWRRPLGKRHRVLHRHVECAPCRLAKCPLDMRCQKALTPDMVIAAARECLATLGV